MVSWTCSSFHPYYSYTGGKGVVVHRTQSQSQNGGLLQMGCLSPTLLQDLSQVTSSCPQTRNGWQSKSQRGGQKAQPLWSEPWEQLIKI